MERRQFLSWVSVGMLASSLPMVLAACGANSDTATEDTPDDVAAEAPAALEEGFARIATVAEVDAAPVLDQDSLAEPVLVLRDPDTAALVALNPTCTHRGCTVEVDGAANELSCACHGARFKFDGSVANGPAAEPLPVYEVKEDAGMVLVKVG